MKAIVRLFVAASLACPAAASAASPAHASFPESEHPARIVDTFLRFCTPPATTQDMHARVMALDPEASDRTTPEEAALLSHRFLARVEDTEVFAIFDDENCALLIKVTDPAPVLGA